ncbi:DNA-binding protein [Geothrix sp. 21YS21S-2]|uniref:DNA-binding protein n=1 Tax=Geothrix sp. 21YS21S-2 TaxID=3068893 RepID=UPI0027BAEE81|nr:DNA-binding protein [Geothrix sp. 21YS21S-2]
MSSSRITKEQVVAAAEALVAEGKNPTSKAVRGKLEGGSYSDICPALKEWRTESAEANQTSRIPLPEAVLGQLTNLGTNVWTAALATAEANLAPQREALAKEKTEAETNLADFRVAIEELEASVEALETRAADALFAQAKAEAAREDSLAKLREADKQIGILQGQSDAYLKEIVKLEAVHREQAAKIEALKGEVVAVKAAGKP